MKDTGKKFHFIAIGGAVMHNLALELLAHGYQVTGSDDEIFDPAKSRLEKAGILPKSMGWFAEKITQDLDGVILGMHARADNPELMRAKELGLEVYSFPEYIYEHSKNKTRVVVGGSHGKTTCTAMLMHVLQQQGVDFDYLVGSQLAGFDRMVKLSDAPLIVIEGDEYLTSALQPIPKFHVYQPHLAMLTGVAWDHINVFPTFENYVKQFEIFLETILPKGKVFWYGGDSILKDICPKSGVEGHAYRCPEYKNLETGVELIHEGRTYDLQIFGKHNVENAAGVACLAKELGIAEADFWKAMESFEGTAKRLEKVYESDALTIIRDFAHAPSKVKASVAAVREQYPNRTFIAVFELHTFSSLRGDFLPGYAGSLDPADKAFVLYDPHVYELKKMPIPAAGFIENTIGNCTEINDPKVLLPKVKEALQGHETAVLLLMSSGNLGGTAAADFIAD